jgi:DNA-binding transcriptional LysR family regulator
MKHLDNKPQLSDLRALLAVIGEGTVTSAASKLGVTQSTLSYQLDGMRKRFADQLFVRIGNRMAPTPFALQLVEPASRVLRIMDNEITELAGFDPRSTDREFRLGVNEIGAITMVPKLVRSLAKVAPHARLVQMNVDTRTMATMLENGDMDVAAGHFAYSSENLIQRLLYKRDYACVARIDHPRIGASISWRQLSRERQLQVPLIPATNAWINEQLKKAGFASGPVMTTQHVAAIPFIVAASDMIATLPLEAFLLLNPVARIRAVRLPRAIPPVAIHQYWHPRMAGDPAVRFFRDLIYSCVHEE